MIIEEMKQIIEQKTGIPVSLLSGETADEVVNTARALLDYRRQNEAERPKSSAEQFSDWLNIRQGIEIKDEAGAALDEIAEAARKDGLLYPEINDGGEELDMPDPRPAREQFVEYFRQNADLINNDGWILIH